MEERLGLKVLIQFQQYEEFFSQLAHFVEANEDMRIYVECHDFQDKNERQQIPPPLLVCKHFKEEFKCFSIIFLKVIKVERA